MLPYIFLARQAGYEPIKFLGGCHSNVYLVTDGKKLRTIKFPSEDFLDEETHLIL